MARPRTPGQAGMIDAYLKKKGSPMAGLGNIFVAAGKKYRVDPRLVVAISGIESSFGKHILGAHNAWGWGPGKPFGSWQEGITTVTRGLRKGYLDRGLKTPDQIVKRYAPGSVGNDESGWANTVNQFLGEMGVMPSSSTASSMTIDTPAPTPTAVPAASMPAPEEPPFESTAGIRGAAVANLRSLAMGGDEAQSPVGMLQGLAAGQQADTLAEAEVAEARALAAEQAPAPAVTAPPAASIAPPPSSGKFMQLPTRWKPTHPTDNLEKEGYTHARDFIGAAGTQVGAPVGGTIIAHGSAQGGQSLSLRGNDGRTYWLGHIDNVLPVGTKVKRGQVIARISSDHPSPHVHMDWT
jgi:murein DD-endopeptidase MepM/ murein hydrolase activator NlpD